MLRYSSSYVHRKRRYVKENMRNQWHTTTLKFIHLKNKPSSLIREHSHVTNTLSNVCIQLMGEHSHVTNTLSNVYIQLMAEIMNSPNVFRKECLFPAPHVAPFTVHYK